MESGEYFFPNQPPTVMELEPRLRKVCAGLAEADRLSLYEIFSNTLPSLTPTTFRVEEGKVVACQNSREIAFPRPLPLIKHSHIVYGYEQWLQRKYALPGFVEVEKGDVVVDCGAYVGGFTMGAVKIAGHVHCFEPDAQNFDCLLWNHRGIGNATFNREGLYSETKTMILNLSASSVEHSFLQPDDGPPVSTCRVEAVTLRDYCRSKGLASLDFVKIEAEGVEIEVFEGLFDMRPRKFAIDVSPERNGESPADEFVKRLAAQGYETRQRGYVLFAHR